MTRVTIAIIEEYEGNCYILKCARCGGRGREPSSLGGYTTKTCTVCSGKGVVGVQVIDGGPPFVQCSKCGGRGRQLSKVEGYTIKPCSACKSLGSDAVLNVKPPFDLDL